ncbi:MAG: tetratricopeptide repeat protein [Paracoccus sp. (in: a-proteobacteria)]|nr:tetratricopeptide repeat protein [Paracoccus sp. (in: a-proteobacteria)]
MFPLFHHVVAAFATAIFAAALLALPARAVDTASDPAGDAALAEAARMDALFDDLAAPEGDLWIRAESDILRAWTQSGSAMIDTLTRRGEGALDLGDPESAIGHLNAAIDHGPDFAQAYYLRGAAFYMSAHFGEAAADLATALRLEPRHFLALTQLGTMLYDMGNQEAALAAFNASLDIHPHQREALDAVEQIESRTGARAI